MKILMIYCSKFGFKPTIKTLESADEHVDPEEYSDIQTVLIQVEEEDMEREKEVVKKMLKNIKWACSKNQVKKVLLHSFAHLSTSKAAPDFTKGVFDQVEERLVNVDYEVYQTPFGYFLDLDIQAPGFSLARIFKSI